jgi:hypothetical protein
VRLNRISMRRFRISCMFELIYPLHLPQSQKRGCTVCVRSNGTQEVLETADLFFQVTKCLVHSFCQRLAPFPSKLESVRLSAPSNNLRICTSNKPCNSQNLLHAYLYRGTVLAGRLAVRNNASIRRTVSGFKRTSPHTEQTSAGTPSITITCS